MCIYIYIYVYVHTHTYSVLFEISPVPELYLDLLFPYPSYPFPSQNWVLLPEVSHQ